MKIINCNICNYGNKQEKKNQISIICKNCLAMTNLTATEFNYYEAGGQDIPSNKKKIERKKNSEARFEIIKKHIFSKNLFIDIGCGSGEMLEVSKDYFNSSLGYEHDVDLFKYSLSENLNVINGDLQREHLNDFKLSKDDEILLTLSHVIEHTKDPINLLKNIFEKISFKKLIYLEVPLYTGFSFQSKGYESSLWYDQHLNLYHQKTFKYFAKQLNFRIIENGYRNFYADKFQKKNLIKAFFKKPFSSMISLITKKKSNSLSDVLFKDYGYIIARKN